MNSLSTSHSAVQTVGNKLGDRYISNEQKDKVHFKFCHRTYTTPESIIWWVYLPTLIAHLLHLEHWASLYTW